MPRDRSKSWLLISEVRGERLQEISEEDAKAEGTRDYPGEDEDPIEEHDWSLCPKCGGTLLYDDCGPCFGVRFDNDCYECDTYVKRFKHKWNHIHLRNAGRRWDDNPLVWAHSWSRVLSRTEAYKYLGRESE